MNGNLLLSTLLALLISSTSSQLCRAEEPTPPPTSQPPDKAQYTLFNPTPADLCRDMDTDRPNITNTPHTIDAGHLQVETGLLDYFYFRDHAPGDNVRADSFGFGQANLRLGVLNNLELNAQLDIYDIVRSHDYDRGAAFRVNGLGDTVLGAKLNLWGDDGGDEAWGTALALQPQFKLATASHGVGNGHFEFLVNAPFLVNLPAGFHLGLQPTILDERNTTNTGYVTGLRNSISIDRVVVDKLDAYLEYAAEVTTEKHVKAPQTIGIGATYPLTNNTVLDFGVNFGLNRATNNIEVLGGISFRF